MEYAHSADESKLKEAKEKQTFYETSDPMVQQLRQRVIGLIAENIGTLIKFCHLSAIIVLLIGKRTAKKMKNRAVVRA